MKRCMVGFMLVLVMCIGVQAADMRDSTNWAHSYEASALPTSDGWTSTGGTGTVAGGIFYQGPETLNGIGYTKAAPGTSFTQLSMEMRMAPTDWVGQPVTGSSLSINIHSDTSYDFGFNVTGTATSRGIRASGFYNAATGPGIYTGAPLDTLQDPAMATYRATFEFGWDDGPGWYMLDMNLYLNDNPTPIQSDYDSSQGPYSTVAEQISMSPGTKGGSYKLDWLRWDTTGIYEPLPEPVTLTLLACGGLLAIIRKKRR